jgi:hypothetical protein
VRKSDLKNLKTSNTSLNKPTMNTSTKVSSPFFYKLLLAVFVLIFQVSKVYSFTDIISLTASSGNYRDETLVRLHNECTMNFDGDWDAYKLTNGGNTPNFYTILNNTKYSINSVPLTFEEFTLSLNLKVAFTGHYIITVKSINDTYNSLFTITLEDKLLNTTQVLQENGTYEFDAATSDNVERFVLHYKKISVVEDNDPIIDTLTTTDTDPIIDTVTTTDTDPIIDTVTTTDTDPIIDTVTTTDPIIDTDTTTDTDPIINTFMNPIVDPVAPSAHTFTASSIEEEKIKFQVTEDHALLSFNNVQSAYATIGIMNSEGKVVYSSENISTTSAIQISLQGNSSGSIYIARIICGNEIVYKKLYY